MFFWNRGLSRTLECRFFPDPSGRAPEMGTEAAAGADQRNSGVLRGTLHFSEAWWKSIALLTR